MLQTKVQEKEEENLCNPSQKIQQVKVFEKIYPVYFGFSADLLFWVAIDSLFLTIVK